MDQTDRQTTPLPLGKDRQSRPQALELQRVLSVWYVTAANANKQRPRFGLPPVAVVLPCCSERVS